MISVQFSFHSFSLILMFFLALSFPLTFCLTTAITSCSSSLLNPFLLISNTAIPSFLLLPVPPKQPFFLPHSVPLGPLCRTLWRASLGYTTQWSTITWTFHRLSWCHRSHCFFSFRRTGAVRVVPSEVISFRFYIVSLTVCYNRSTRIMWLFEHGDETEDRGEKCKLSEMNCCG